MPRPDIEEKLRKLAPMGTSQADIAWLLYLSGVDGERIKTEDLVDVALVPGNREGLQGANLPRPVSPRIVPRQLPARRCRLSAL
jgi:hypothetical protein